MTAKTRFAPSPTGYIHIGNARTALIAWLSIRKTGGEFLLRIDDTDTERSKDEYTQAIFEDLQWLGLDWDGLEHQSKRLERYTAAIETLKDNGRLYPCYETPEELALKRKSLLGRGLPPIYDRAALELTKEKIAAYEAEGRKPHWRFKLLHAPITWQDAVRGDVAFDGALLSDPVVIREDGTPLYHICSVIDDIDFKITQIVRGEDHVANTACHIQMFEAFGAAPPDFAHITLLSDKEGAKFSKRLGSLNIRHLREETGLEAMALTSLLSRIGTSDPIEAQENTQALIDNFDFSKFSRNLPKFNIDDVYRLNSKILHGLGFDDVKDRLAEMGVDGADEAFWLAVRPNIEKLADARDWWQVAHGPVEPVIEDPEFAKIAAELLPDTPWDETTWESWAGAIKDKTGRKGKDLFMPIRAAITGQTHGPELRDLLLLIGRDRVLERLKSAA
ncbi:MAG: glutamate--tRNA ligase [Micavibrio sp.]|nr:MAG: glutamate--tRNA ligase [Micavibrio sp.]